MDMIESLKWAKIYDDQIAAAFEAFGGEGAISYEEAKRIDPEVARTVFEWSQEWGVPKSRAYSVLRHLVDTGKWDRLAARPSTTSGRSAHYYYPKGVDPFLSDAAGDAGAESGE